MSNNNAPIKPVGRPATRSASKSNPVSPRASTYSVDRMASSSASSSISATSTPTGKQDQVIYRYYLKTVGVLVDGRLTHYGNTTGAGGKAGAKKREDKWFNLVLPDVDLHKPDLRVFLTVSSYQPNPRPPPGVDSCTIPPLLVAFILDTSDLPSGQALMWTVEGVKHSLDPNLIGGKGKGKEKEKEKASGIVLERWTLQASLPPSPHDNSPSASIAPSTAYRLGIAHFRALYSLVRLLPAYRLFRRLRRTNNGLRLGIKLWAPEGFNNSPEGIAEAWEIMERGLIGLDVGLDTLAQSDHIQPVVNEGYDMPVNELFGVEYRLGIEFRPDADFHVEDLESVLSEKFSDMDEEWFTPTVARHRLKEESRAASASPSGPPTRRVSGPTSIPNPSPIPLRQQAATPGSFKSASLSKPIGKVSPGSGSKPASGGTEKWGMLAEGLPFAGPAPSTPSKTGTPEPGSLPPSSAAVAARRLSGHSIHPFTISSSPSTSLLRSTPPLTQNAQIPHPPGQAPGRPSLSSSKPSSVGRTSSFLSQSGRSFTHAQLANMNMFPGSASPPVMGVMSGHQLSNSPPVHSPVSPSSLSFTKQPVSRNVSGRPPFLPSSSSPFMPGSLDKDANIFASSPGAPPQIIKRYSSSLSQRQPRLVSGSGGSPGSSGDTPSLPGSYGGLLRRTSTRMSQESGLRHSIENPSTSTPGPDDDDIQAFLKTLDTLPQPPSVAAHAIHSSRSHLPSTSSSLSTPSVPPSPAPAPLQSSSASPNPPKEIGRAPMTKVQIDEALKRMAGSFNLSASRLITDSPRPSQPLRPSPSPIPPGLEDLDPSVGLLTASRPSPPPRAIAREAPEIGSRPMARRQNSNRSSSAKAPTGSPLAGEPMQLSGEDKHPPLGTARSLPGKGSAPLADDALMPRTGVPIPIGDVLSPQTTGGGDSLRSRRGPVLLRGGFESRQSPAHAKASASSSPSHSPIRDFGGRLGARDLSRALSVGERQAEEELDSWQTGTGTTGTGRSGRRSTPANMVVPPAGTTGYLSNGAALAAGAATGTRCGVTAPSSLGTGEDEDREQEKREIRGRSGRAPSEG